MSKTSCISHPAKQQLIIIREDYLEICDCDHCAAAILNVMEYWTNIKLGSAEQSEIDNTIAAKEGLEASQDTELWIYKSHEEFQTELLNLFGMNKIGAALTLLKGKGFLTTRNNPRFGWDRTVQYLFMTEAIQTALSSLELKSTSFKIKASKGAKLKNGSVENKAAIPETTTETPQKTITSPDGKVSKSELDSQYDTIAEVWETKANGTIVSMRGMIFGSTKTRGQWKLCQFEPPATIEELKCFAPYMLIRMRDKNLTDKPTTPVTIQRWFYDFRLIEARKANRIEGDYIPVAERTSALDGIQLS